MDHDKTEDSQEYRVVINQDKQYSVWPSDRELPFGWQEVGKQGSKEDCLAYIDKVWTDMRPLSVRVRLESNGR